MKIFRNKKEYRNRFIFMRVPGCFYRNECSFFRCLDKKITYSFTYNKYLCIYLQAHPLGMDNKNLGCLCEKLSAYYPDCMFIVEIVWQHNFHPNSLPADATAG